MQSSVQDISQWPLEHTPGQKLLLVSQDLREKGVEVNFRRALLEQCQVPMVALVVCMGAAVATDFPASEVGHSS